MNDSEVPGWERVYVVMVACSVRDVLDNLPPSCLWSLWKNRRNVCRSSFGVVDNVVHIVDKFVDDWLFERMFAEQGKTWPHWETIPVKGG